MMQLLKELLTIVSFVVFLMAVVWFGYLWFKRAKPDKPHHCRGFALDLDTPAEPFNDWLKRMLGEFPEIEQHYKSIQGESFPLPTAFDTPFVHCDYRQTPKGVECDPFVPMTRDELTARAAPEVGKSHVYINEGS